ncbi:hypothetical protein [Streptomyces sp. NPDC094032]|uniref:lipase family protein n=1 Tax=Streptomyces sp. NPDC094032 TaxID=3155308 RepID=UPI00332B114C
MSAAKARAVSTARWSSSVHSRSVVAGFVRIRSPELLLQVAPQPAIPDRPHDGPESRRRPSPPEGTSGEPRERRRGDLPPRRAPNRWPTAQAPDPFDSPTRCRSRSRTPRPTSPRPTGPSWSLLRAPRLPAGPRLGVPAGARDRRRAAQERAEGVDPSELPGGVYTFGQPRTCDRLLAAAHRTPFSSRHHRFVNNNDVVPTLPPEPACPTPSPPPRTGCGTTPSASTRPASRSTSPLPERPSAVVALQPVAVAP